jgi:nicotinamidase-related amidase
MIKSKIDPKDTLVLFADLQEGIAELSRTLPFERLKKGVGALARIAKVLGMPAIVTAVQQGEGPARMIPEINQALGDLPIMYRTTADALLNDAIAAAIKASGRRTILISGVATELAVQLPALSGVDLGYRTFVVVDACGGVSERTEQAALARIQQNGGGLVSVMTLAGELAGDFRSAETSGLVPIIFEMATA